MGSKKFIRPFYCIIDEMKRGLLRFALDTVKEDLDVLTAKYAEPEKESRLAKYMTESVLDELCETSSVSCGRIDDNEIFELEEIDGEKYLNTYDVVTVGEDGALFYTGRMNKFFVNNQGVRFDAGLVESAVSAQPGIESCGMVPGYSKYLRDTVPVLYVKPSVPAEDARKTVKEALKRAFIGEGIIKESNLPSECVITDEIPYNQTGKVDVHQITTGSIDGYRYTVIPVRGDGELKDIRLQKYKKTLVSRRSVPDELDS